jgi:hypothetical protein
MEPTCEEATPEEPARGSARSIGRLGPQRGQEARQQVKRPQGRSGQKPQEDNRRQAQRSSAATRTPQERVSAAIASIRERFGKYAIGFGNLGMRYAKVDVRLKSLMR